MKKTLSLLLALCMIVSLCACGSAAPQSAPAAAESKPAAEDGTTDTAESAVVSAEEIPAEPEPEKIYKTEDRLLLVKEAVNGHSLPYSSAAITGRIFDEVIEYHYDEFGQLRLISTVLKQAVREGLIPFNVAANAEPPRTKKRAVSSLQSEDLPAILSALEREPIKWRKVLS